MTVAYLQPVVIVMLRNEVNLRWSRGRSDQGDFLLPTGQASLSHWASAPAGRAKRGRGTTMQKATASLVIVDKIGGQEVKAWG